MTFTTAEIAQRLAGEVLGDATAPLTCRFPPASASDTIQAAVANYNTLLVLAQASQATALAELASLKYLTALTALNNVTAWAAVATAQNTRTVRCARKKQRW